MAVIKGLSLVELDARADAFAGRVTDEIHGMLTHVSREFKGMQTVDDLASIPTLWTERVTKLLTEVKYVWFDSATSIKTQIIKAHEVLTAAITVPNVANEAAELYLADAENRLSGISNIVWEVIRSVLLEGFQAGESIEQLRSRIVDATTLAEPRAGVIARTEIVSASNAGSYAQMKATGFTATKEWLATRGTRTRATHRLADGQTIPLDQPFTVGGHALKFPGDPGGPPEEVINCRCTVIYEIVDEDLIDEDLTAAASEVFHLPGKHDQDTHGNDQADEFDPIPMGRWEALQLQRRMDAANPPPWDDAQRDALRYYSSTTKAYTSINKCLRKIDPSECTSSTDDKIDNIKKAMKPSTDDVVLYRKTNVEAFRITDLDQLSNLVGKKISDNGVISTSFMDGPWSGNVYMEIEAPRGSRMAWVGDISDHPYENEIMLAPDTEFEIISVTEHQKDPPVKAVKLRVIPRNDVS